MFDKRSYELLKEIIDHQQISKSQLLRKLNLSERQFKYDLEKINTTLANLDIPEIKLQNNFFRIDQKVIQLINTDNHVGINPSIFIISEHERVYMIYLYTFIRRELVSNYHYQLLLDVSKNTALAEVKKMKRLCKEWDIDFLYTRAKGYHLVGDEKNKRKFASYCVDYLLSQPMGKEIIILILKYWKVEEYLVKTQCAINDLLKSSSIKLVKNRKSEMITRITFIRIRDKSADLEFSDAEKDLLKKQPAFQVAEKITDKLFEKANHNEAFYICIQLIISLQEDSNCENKSLKILTDEIIKEFEKITLLPIDNKENLRKSLYNHLVPAYFRVMFDIPLISTLTNKVKEEYPELFNFVRRALTPLSMWTKKKISEDEIAYFTIHFGGYLENKRTNHVQLNAIIVCTNGVSSSLMLKAQLNELFPNINLSSILSLDQFKQIPSTSYDLIFSTINIESIKPVYIVKPLLSQMDKNYLMQTITSDFPRSNNRNISIEQIMSTIQQHADIRDEANLYSDLVDLIYFKNEEKRSYSPMLSDLLTKDTIHITNEELSWKDAIAYSAKPLLQTGKIKNSYIEAMIQNVEQMGAYIHVGNGIAIPHARPEEGVNQVGMSLLRTKKPVLLLDKDNYPIDIFICIAAVDNDTHLKALAQLTRLLANGALLHAIKNAETPDEITDIIKKEVENL